MHTCERDDLFEALEFAHDECTMCPWTRVRDVEVVSTRLRGKFAAFLDEVAKLRLPALELAAFVVGRYPVGDFVFGLEMRWLAFEG
jgi:hypothetical protein